MTDTRTTNTPSPCSEPSTDSRGLEELPSGRWRVKLRDPTRPGRWMPGGSFATRAEAVDYRNGLLAILAGVLRDAELVDEGSLQSFGDAWLDERELAGDTRSIETFRSQWRHVSGTELAKKLLRDITAVDVLQAAASGGLPERSIADLLEAVEGLELLQLATELRAARGPARVVTALRTAVAALDLSDGALGGADSADSADRCAPKRL